MNTAVLLLVFKRLEATRQVLEAIRLAKPPRLYIASDGPRANVPEESRQVSNVREFLASSVDWDCSVQTLFRDQNLGCRFGPESGITWFFEHEAEGIVLEDDCIPGPDFFEYCQWALETYRDDSRVWHIMGNNFSAPSHLYNDAQISFSALAQVWGWATWRDRWVKYQGNPFYLMRQSREKRRAWNISALAKVSKMSHVSELQKGLDAWDYQWQVTILNHGGLCLSSKNNLISNIGDDEHSTHIAVGDKRTHGPVGQMDSPIQYQVPILNQELTQWYEKRMGLQRFTVIVHALAGKARRRFAWWTKNAMAALLFVGVKPIIVASSGRCGSTLLFKAIADSLIRDRFGVNPHSWVGKRLASVASTFSARFEDVKNSRIPVHKTHALYSEAAPDEARLLFVYGNPLDGALSAQAKMKREGRVWFEQHQFNLEAAGSPDDLLQEDVLNFEGQINAWMKPGRSSILSIRYERIWEDLDEVRRFLSLNVELPPRRDRRPVAEGARSNRQLFARLESMTKVKAR